MSHPDRLRLRIHHIEHPYLHGTDAEGRMYRCSIRDSHYIADMEAL